MPKSFADAFFGWKSR